MRGRSKKSGRIKNIIRENITDPFDVPRHQSCVLDVAENGGMTLEEVGEIMNITRERVRQIQQSAFITLEKQLRIEEHLNAEQNNPTGKTMVCDASETIEDLEQFSTLAL